MTTEIDVRLSDGRNLHVYDTAPPEVASVAGQDSPRLAVFWQHGTPNLGSPPEPLFAAAERLGMRWVSFDRPGYGGSTPHPGRTLATVAGDVAEASDALGIDRFAVVGHSGGGSHALACAATLGDRVVGVVSVAALAPYGAADLDWFAGMIPSGVESLGTARGGRAARAEAQAGGEPYDPEFTAADLEALSGEWAWFQSVVGPALDAGPDGAIDDDVAYVSPWGCDPTRITAPVLLLHGERDGIAPSAHGEWLARSCPTAELWSSPADGHISILTRAEGALRWLRAATT